jgi:hypothetical protein
MEHLLHNPVYHALCTGDARFNMGTDTIKFFDEEVSPFAGVNQDVDKGFDELYSLLPPQRNILYATPLVIKEPGGWQLLQKIEGLQFIFSGEIYTSPPALTPVPLNTGHVQQMIELATLTKPGPFGKKTIWFGNYFGFFANERLVAMTGQRLHVNITPRLVRFAQTPIIWAEALRLH